MPPSGLKGHPYGYRWPRGGPFHIYGRGRGGDGGPVWCLASAPLIAGGGSLRLVHYRPISASIGQPLTR